MDFVTIAEIRPWRVLEGKDNERGIMYSTTQEAYVLLMLQQY